MVQEINDEPGRIFGQVVLLPGHTTKDCIATNIDLETRLTDKLVLGIPFLSAAMMSVTGNVGEFKMPIALGNERGLGVLPTRLSIDEQAGMVRRSWA